MLSLFWAGTIAAKPKTEKIDITPYTAESGWPPELRDWEVGTTLPRQWGFRPVFRYPREVERVGIAGEVELAFAVNEHGWIVYAEVTRATDMRFAEAALRTLRWHYPSMPNNPGKRARYSMPLTFTPTEDSDVRVKDLAPEVSILGRVKNLLSFTRPIDFNPTYPGLAVAKESILPGMSQLEVWELLGLPPVTEEHPTGEFVMRYGDILSPELKIWLRKDKVFRIEQPKPARKKKR